MDGKSNNLSFFSSFVQNSHCAASAFFVSKSSLSVHEKHPCHICEVKQSSE